MEQGLLFQTHRSHPLSKSGVQQHHVCSHRGNSLGESSWLLESTLDGCPWNTHRCFINPHKSHIQRRIIRFLATCFLIYFSASSGFKISVENVRDAERTMGKCISECALNSVSGSDLLDLSNRLSSVCTSVRCLTRSPTTSFSLNWRGMDLIDGLFGG